jgi:hypothetical protein
VPFPRIKHCIIAEDVRLEQAGKSSILGFYGIAPDVQLTLKFLDKPLDRLVLMFIGGTGSGNYKFHLQLSKPNGEPVLNLPEGAVTVPSIEGIANTNFILGFSNLPLQQEGTYRIKLISSDGVQFETTFEVKQATPEQVIKLGL